MPVTDSDNPTALRRKMFLLTLGIKPTVLRKGAGLHPVRASLVLSGAEKLTPAEARKFTQAVGRKIAELFS